MNKIIFEGSHYDMGYKWGKMLNLNGIKVLNNVPFPITEEHVVFGEKCTPFYMEHFPEILDEIQGISDGQDCDISQLKAVLFSMYCIMPSTNCSCFVVKLSGGNSLLGRNSDFLTKIEELYMNTRYNFSSSSFSFLGNTTAFVQMEDGMNQHGLAIGLTSVAPHKANHGINAGMLLRLFLEKCKTIEDVLILLQTLPIASSQTFVMTDELGNAALVEASPERTEIQQISETTNYACSTNMFNLPSMKELNRLPKDNWFAKERYHTMDSFLSQNSVNMNIEQAKGLLAGKEGFLCQYDRNTGKDTVWSVVYCPADLEAHFADGNPSRVPFVKESIF